MFQKLVVVFLQLAIAQLLSGATLTARAIGPSGAAIGGVEIFLYRSPEKTALYHSTSDSNGRFRLEQITPGDYVVQITSKDLAYALRTHIAGDTDLGTLQLRENICALPNVVCDDFSSLMREIHLPCVDADHVNDRASIFVGTEELQKRAIKRAEPKWPQGVAPVDVIVVYIIIDGEGKVLCAGVANKSTSWDEAALSAVRQWTFEPVVRHGKAATVVGQLRFDLTHAPPE